MPHTIWVDFPSCTSATAGVLSITLIPVNQELMSLITLISMLLKHCPLRPSKEALCPLLSLMKAVTQLPMLNWLQWMLTTFLIAGMAQIHFFTPSSHQRYSTTLPYLRSPPTQLGGNVWCTSI